MTLDEDATHDHGTTAHVGREAPDLDPSVVVPILRSGILAREICRRGTRADVAAVFERSFYLRCGEAFVCVGEPAIGNGPLTLIADIDASPRLSDLGLRPDQPAAIFGRHITIGSAVRFTLDGCEPWHPPGWPAPLSPIRLIETCAVVARRAAITAPAEGLARVVFCADEPVTPLACIARTCIARFESWLSDARERNHAPATESIAGLIGLGPGLTPSGDDFLIGALALLDALAERKLHAALAGAIAQASPASTSPLSDCFLKAAAAGHVGENFHRAVSSVIAGEVEAAIAVVRTIGHSSGWDMLAGIATTLQVVAAERPASP